MERRGFLRGGVLAGGGLVGAGCASSDLGAALVAPPPPMTDEEVQAFLARLDGQMKAIEKEAPLGKILLAENVDAAARARGEALSKRALRSLLLTGSFRDLPMEARMHPDVQSRMFAGLGEMTEAAEGITSYMRSLTPTERADLSRALKRDPDLGMRVMGAIDDEAARFGVSMERRLHMRQLAANVCGRLRQSSDLFLDDTCDKVEKMAARDATVESIERRLVAQIGEDAYFRLRDEAEAGHALWQGRRVAQGPVFVDARSDPSAHASHAEPREPRGTPLLIVGGIMLGLSVITIVGGVFLTIASGVPGAIMLTIGGLHFIGGLVCLIIGGVLRANSP
ncbi:MAG TPA: hypothetical protein VL400_15085 [Polyangiaceae bacterium]|jgi:hypothetical protein|nr:hypothetical protein [Polyangiaceae bacterium]